MATDRIFDALSSLGIKAPCKAATTTNITLSGLQSVDGVSLAQNDRVLVKNQTTGSENGIYLADTGIWARGPDLDGTKDIAQGTQIRITNGTTLLRTTWEITTANPIVIGTTSITFTEIIAAGCWSCIETRSVTSGTNVDFDLPTGFDVYILYFAGLRPATNDQELRVQLSNDEGATFLAGTGYRTSPHGTDSNGVESATGNVQNGDHWTLTLGTGAGKGVDTASPAGASGHIEISHARDSANRTRFVGRTAFENAANGASLLWNVTTGGVHTTAETHDAIRLFWNAGDHEFGDYILTGLAGP